METLPERSQTVETRPERQLPSGKNKVERLSSQTKGLFDDFTSWVELRLKLFQMEIQEKVQAKVNEAIIKIAPLVVGALAGLFALVTVALFVGWWLGHPAWGFLSVTLLLGLVTGGLFAKKKQLDKEDSQASSNGAVS